MILSSQVREVSHKFLTEALKTQRGALREILEPGRYNEFVRQCTLKVNQTDLLVMGWGHRSWDWKDFVKKMSAAYGRVVLKNIEHQYAKEL